jgi:peptidoglycan/xylan/chitin deacetylase (PgdA/CDA1 family)
VKRAAVTVLLLGLLSAGCSRAAAPRAGGPTTRPPATSPTVHPTPPSSPAPTAPPFSPAPTSPPPSPVPTSPPPTSPAAGLPASLIGTEWEVLPTSRKVVALTFDAGANDAAVASILRTLREKEVPASFFLTGVWTDLYPDQARAIAASYPVGNHTYDHPLLTTLPDSAVRSEVTRAAQAIRTATGRDARPLFRFPFGDRDARTIGIVNGLGYGAIRWTVDTLGWKGTSGGQSVDAIVARVLGALRPGEIVLMHVGSNPDDGSTLDADALPRIIDELRARGYGFVTVAEFV